MTFISKSPAPVNKNTPHRITICLAIPEALSLLQNISSRAGWLRNRREPDPMIKAIAQLHAEKCEAIAAKIANAIGGDK